MSTPGSRKEKDPRCDICGYKDGHKGCKMLRCEPCGLNVHKECYGMPTYQKESLRCWGCKAVGCSFQINKVDKDGKRLELEQKERPTSCALCSVSGGVHAMHPLFDKHGSKGRQVFCEDPEPRLVWVHTLCAFFLTTKHRLMACDPFGDFDGDDDSDDSYDERSVNPELEDETYDGGSDYGDFVPVHHFVYFFPHRSGGEHTKWSKLVEKHQQLKCGICNADDTPETVLRIPFQCMANDKNEYIQFQGKHHDIPPNETCTKAVHVGCARWGGGNKNNVKRVYYFPGDDNRDPVQCIYCTYHAEDLVPQIQSERQAEEEERLAETKARRKLAMAKRMCDTDVVRPIKRLKKIKKKTK